MDGDIVDGMAGDVLECVSRPTDRLGVVTLMMSSTARSVPSPPAVDGCVVTRPSALLRGLFLHII